ncbi:MAG: hypothetical protein RIF34_03770, partial [Candidatus Kapaibacterium sp.]
MAAKKSSTKKASVKTKSTKSKATTAKKSASKKVATTKNLKMDKAHLLGALRNMITARTTDNVHLGFVKQGKSFFHIGVSGHECIQT